METRFLYCHGFASSPDSNKARAFREKFDALGIPLDVPDLEEGDFKNLTLSRQIKLLQRIMEAHPKSRFGIIGSSMGGYLAALTAQVHKEIAGMYLMCPGFNFLKRWRQRHSQELGGSEPPSGLITVYHYRYNENMELDSGIFQDAERWETMSLDRSLPTRIVHGIKDDTVPIEESRRFVREHPWATLEELDSDHGLLSHIDWILNDCLEFLGREGLWKNNG